MGCDIHAFIEIKVEDQWHCYGQCDIGRNYQLFGYMAKGVRMDVENAMECRGLPQDMSVVTDCHYKDWDLDAHNMSWMSLGEMQQLCKWAEAKEIKIGPYRDPSILFGLWFFGDLPTHLPDKEIGVEDMRLIYWFDN